MPVNIFQIEDTQDETETRLPGLSLPEGMDIETADIDHLLDPDPLPPWTSRHVLTAGEAVVIRAGRHRNSPGYLTIRDEGRYGVLKLPHHGRHDLVAVGNGTVTVIEAKSPWVKYATDTYTVAGSFPISVMVCPTSHDTADFDWVVSEAVRVSDWFNHHQTDPLEGYETYAVANWDGYDALPITAETLQTARSILKSLPKTFGEPECSPGADGSVGFEWLMDQRPLRKLFIDIGPGRTWKAYWRLANGQTGTIPRKRVTLATTAELNQLFAALAR